MTSTRLPDGCIPGSAPNAQDIERMYAAIGRAVTEFATLELTLDEHLLNLLAVTDAKPKRDDVTKMNSFREKVGLLRKLVRLQMHSDTPSDALIKLCDLLIIACDRRDDIVHSKCLPIAGKRNSIHQQWTPGRPREKTLNGKSTTVATGVFTMTVADVEDAQCIIQDAVVALDGHMNDKALWTRVNNLRT